ncbi:hypothetical protein DERP_001174 [Dermatophagoides pteronyssinus]|uniref:Uncharacterized protein n=1 Tax=Dermatophagoides pteronyssinus TaxID=6956 RepID=A0ABQ8JDR0_DERPT|nr:hypothetical protein DERP_001174 [Dermatophagoides pteronyssinus]
MAFLSELKITILGLDVNYNFEILFSIFLAQMDVGQLFKDKYYKIYFIQILSVMIFQSNLPTNIIYTKSSYSHNK